MHERECKGYISFNRGVNEFNRGVNELNRGVNDLNRGVNHSVARQGCNLLRAAVTSAVTSQGCCCGNLQIHPLDLGQHLFIDNSQSRLVSELHFDMNAIHCDINVNRVISLLVGYVIHGVFSSFWLTSFILLIHMMRMLGSNAFVYRLPRMTGWCNVPNLFTSVEYRLLESAS